MERPNRKLRSCSRDILTLASSEILELLIGKEHEVLGVVEHAYRLHGAGHSALPHSTFLRFPQDQANRIIALPAYLGGEIDCAGVKWIASFPENIKHGTDRASALLILNDMATGRPKAILEGSIISARRTAASAALSACLLQQKPSSVAGIIGCGPINFEIVRFLRAACPEVSQILIYDLDRDRSQAFKEQCNQQFAGLRVGIALRPEEVYESVLLISFATTASKPHIFDAATFLPGATVLHISLRDLAPELVLACDNVVDDLDHVARAETSIHLAQKSAGHLNFVRCSIADVLNKTAAPRNGDDRPVIFSPFGLGILDIAVGQYIYDLARNSGAGTIIPAFLPGSLDAGCGTNGAIQNSYS